MMSKTHYGVFGHPEPRDVHKQETIARKDVESRVLSGLQTQLMHPDLIREYITT